MRRPCQCDDVARCKACWLFHNDERYWRLWSPQCVHFRDIVKSRTAPDGRECDCKTKWLYGCDVHGRCARTQKAARDGVMTCGPDLCPDYEPDETD